MLNKKYGLSLTVAALLAGNMVAAGGMNIAGGKLTGDIRALSDMHNTAEYGTHDAHDVSATGVGINPTFAIKAASNITFEIGAGIAIPVAESEDAAAAHDFAFGKENDDHDASETYALLNKYNVAYDFGSGFVKIGAQDLATPFFDGDDVSLVPNTFTAAVVGYTGVKYLALEVSMITEMAGAVDGGADDAYMYNSMSTQAYGMSADDKAVTEVSAVYENEEAGANGQIRYMMMAEPVEGQGDVSATYLDFGKAFGNVNVSAQYFTYADDLQSNTATGVMAEVGLGDIGITAAMNNFGFTDDGVGGNSAPKFNAWGGYPEYVAGDGVDASMADWDGGSASMLGVAYSGVDHLDASVTYLTFSDVASVVDVIIGYGLNDHTHLGFVHEMVDVEDDDNAGDYTVTKLHASYHF